MKRNAASPLRGRWRRMLGLTWLDDDDTIVPNAAKVQSPAPALDESATGVSFIWPRDTDLTREQIEVAVGDRAAAAPSPTPDAGRTAETVAQHAPRPQEWTHEVVEALAEQAHVAWSGWTRWMIDQWSPEFVERWERQIATPYADLSESEKESDRKEARAYLAAIDKAAAPRPQEITAQLPTGVPLTFTERPGATSYDVYHDGLVTTVAPDGTIVGSRRWTPGPTPVLGGVTGEVDAEPGGTWTRVSSIERVWGEGVQGPAALLDYADSLVEFRAIEYGDAFDDKRAIRRQLAACRGDCGDGPCGCDLKEWPR